MHAAGGLCVTNNVGRLCLLAALAACRLAAGEYAVLAGGGLLYADRHEAAGDRWRLYRGEGFIELPQALVAGFEPAPPPAAAPAPPPQPSGPPDPRSLIARTAARYGGEDFARLLDSVARVESGYRPQAVSPKGARGLMQLMPETARRLEADPDDPAENVEAGARLLRDLLLKYLHDPYQVRLALAAYNAGPGAVERHGGVPPYRETLGYIERVLEHYRGGKLTRAASGDR